MSPYPFTLFFEKYLPQYDTWFADKIGMVDADAAARWCKGVAINGIELRNIRFVRN